MRQPTDDTTGNTSIARDVPLTECDPQSSLSKCPPKVTHWEWVRKTDPWAVDLANRHYSRQKPGSHMFTPPGNTLVLRERERRAVFAWHRPDPKSGCVPLNKLYGWTCTIFRNESPIKSSLLILEAEDILKYSGYSCGPHGLLTYVWGKKIRSSNPGCCFKKAGWIKVGCSKDGQKDLFWKSWEMAGQA